MKIFGFEITKSVKSVPIKSVDDLSSKAYQGQNSFSDWDSSIYDGGKFPGGFGPTQLFQTDYWTLRQRSNQLFTENLYARGLVQRLVTNEINTGLTPEAYPDAKILEESEDYLNEWSEVVENRFHLWGKNPQLCDFKQKDTFGALQRAARTEALISGDVLIIVRQSPKTHLPQIELIRGEKVRTPLGGADGSYLRSGHKIKYGVELNNKGREVAYWISENYDKSTRIPAWGEKSHRRTAWLVFGTPKRLNDIRGQPLLSLVLQSMKELDRYRDSAQRKAVINSILAMFIKKTEDKIGTLPISGAAVRRDQVVASDETSDRKYNIASLIPGVILEELQVGEEPVGFNSSGTDVNFNSFEDAILRTVAWANEIPPEILFLAFQNNYTASQAAINEFKIYLNKIWGDWGETFCTPIYIEWLISELLLKKIEAHRLLEAWRDPMKYDIFGAWTSVEWYGSIKPSTDMVKQGKGSQLLVDNGWSTNAREARTITGTKYTKNIERLKRENQLKVEALRPLAEFQKEFGYLPDAIVAQRDKIEEIPVKDDDE